MEALLDERCGECHGSDFRSRCSGSTSNCEGMKYIDDMPRLIEEEKVFPCRWEGSPLAEYTSGAPGLHALNDVPPLFPSERARLESFVVGICTDLTEGGPNDAERIASEALLRQSCGGCHGATGADAGPPPGGLGDVANIASVIPSRFIVPCVSSSSAIIGALRAGTMPPPGSDAPRPSSEDIEKLAVFIDRPCAR